MSLDVVLTVLALANLAYLVHTKSSLQKRLDEVERVGVLVTADKKAEIMAQPMSPRERIRWLERRLNGSLRATP